jgi:hypothetical protein
MREGLVSAGVILRGHENQARFCFCGQTLRRTTASFQNANDGCISRDHTNSDRSNYGDAENQRHEERNHGQPPCLDVRNGNIQMPPDQVSSMRHLQSTCVDARRY